MKWHTYTADTVANYVLSLVDPEDNDVSNLKLQKLCYYAQGIASAVRGAPLFRDRIEAWDHGPVVLNLYHKHKSNGSQPINLAETVNVCNEAISETDMGIINDVYDFYGQYSAWRLRNMTHTEKPWLDAYESNDREISVDALIHYFRPKLKRAYVEERKQKARSN